MPKLNKRLLDGLTAAAADAFTWDSELRGFGVRVKPSGTKTYVVQYRTPEARTRRLAIGKVGTLSPDEARKIAREKLAAVAAGSDPSAERRKTRSATTVGELADLYLEAARAGLVTTRFRRQKRESTVAFDGGRIARHIQPLIGQVPVNKLTRADVQRMADFITQGKTAGVFRGKPRGKAVVSGGAGTAARVVGLLGGIWSWAEKRGHVTGNNPAHGIETQAGGPKNRVLSPDELRSLGKILVARIGADPQAVTAVKIITMTGLRRQEACGLRWDEIDELGSCLRLKASKTGRSTRPVAPRVLALLTAIPRGQDGSPFVFASTTGLKCADLKKRIAALFNAAGLKDARSHDLRRTFATVAADEGFGDATIAELLGHSQRSVTERHYVRRPDSALVAAATAVAERIAVNMGEQAPAAAVLEFKREGVA